MMIKNNLPFKLMLKLKIKLINYKINLENKNKFL